MANISFKGGGFGKKGPWRNFTRKNDRIKAKEVRVIGSDGNQLGVMETGAAIALAKQEGLDLVEISASASPPVCKIVDFGKYKYDEGKKQKSGKTTSTKIKEVKFRFCTEEHDYQTKLRHVLDFLIDGNKVKIGVVFRGREMDLTNLGFNLIKKVAEDAKEFGVPDSEPRLAGRMVLLSLSPVKSTKKKIAICPEKDLNNGLEL
ncbi:MAG: translation initiation factor IF-3 [Puniceicoccales bacterium]|jgi:translation initiation factor IF-3|nr:translation initiation factor IF-3 [Puniceicoccales bacterium]